MPEVRGNICRSPAGHQSQTLCKRPALHGANRCRGYRHRSAETGRATNQSQDFGLQKCRHCFDCQSQQPLRIFAAIGQWEPTMDHVARERCWRFTIGQFDHSRNAHRKDRGGIAKVASVSKPEASVLNFTHCIKSRRQSPHVASDPLPPICRFMSVLSDTTFQLLFKWIDGLFDCSAPLSSRRAGSSS